MRSSRFVPRFHVGPFVVSVVALLAATGEQVHAQPSSSATLTVLPFVDPDFEFRGDYGLEITNQGLVAGYGEVDDTYYQGVRWETNGTITSLGSYPNYPATVAHSLSGNGQVMCGVMYDDALSESKAFVWTQAQGIRILAEFAPHSLEAKVVSDDGSTVWGAWETNAAGWAIMKWNASTLQNQGVYSVADFPVQAGALDASADGQIAVGFETSPKEGQRAVLITPEDFDFLPKMEAGGPMVAYGITPDGSVVIGYGEDTDEGTSPFIWTQAGGIRTLPRLNAASPASLAFDIAENGTIVGQNLADGDRPQDEAAMLWIAERPFKLESYLQSQYGVDTSAWTAIQTVRSISRNGRALAGYGVLGGRTRAFRLQFFGDRPPVANAGVDVRKNDAAASGANVRLNGRKSVDPDGGTLAYRWSGIRFDNKTTARPTAKFPVGTTTVTLKVTDGFGATAIDTVRVIVKAKRSSVRSEGLAANEAVADAATLTATANDSREANEAALVAGENLAAADAIGAALGDAFVWGESEGPEGAAADYGALRSLQSAYGAAAAASLAQAYVETGDPAYAEAYRSATSGMKHALADLAE